MVGLRERMRSVLSCSSSENGRSTIVVPFDPGEFSVNECSSSLVAR